MKAREVLAEADKALERGMLYGPFAEMLEEIAKVWTVALKHPVTASQVALCMIGLKLVRAAQSPQYADSWIDLAGYAAGGAEAAEPKTKFPEEHPFPEGPGIITFKELKELLQQNQHCSISDVAHAVMNRLEGK